MDKQSAEGILKLYAKRTTDKRLALLKLLMSVRKAFDFSELEEQLSVLMDRVTIYRTLHTFVKVGLVIKLVDHRGNAFFMFNHTDHSKLSMHPHLRCRGCEKVICLPSLPEEYLEKLKKFEIGEMYFLMEGLCQECKDTNDKDCILK